MKQESIQIGLMRFPSFQVSACIASWADSYNEIAHTFGSSASVAVLAWWLVVILLRLVNVLKAVSSAQSACFGLLLPGIGPLQVNLGRRGCYLKYVTLSYGCDESVFFEKYNIL